MEMTVACSVDSRVPAGLQLDSSWTPAESRCNPAERSEFVFRLRGAHVLISRILTTFCQRNTKSVKRVENSRIRSQYGCLCACVLQSEKEFTEYAFPQSRPPFSLVPSIRKMKNYIATVHLWSF